MVTILQGDAIETLRTLPDESVQCVVTSPPYWGLRDYGVAGQIGLEDTFGEYLWTMVSLFQEVRRVLRDDGTAWVNMGDCYVSSGGSGVQGSGGLMATRSVVTARISQGERRPGGAKPKDLLGQPWRLAFALQEAGWWLRRDIIWHKPNPMPESCKDRPTTAHEYVFLLTKSERYFYNRAEAREPVTGNAHARGSGVNPKAIGGWASGPGSHSAIDHNRTSAGSTKFPKARQNESFSAAVNGLVEDRNYRSVWTLPTQPLKEDHFAAFPEALVRRCIIAGTRPGDMVLDPFGGSGTTGRVAIELGRRATLIELNPKYVEIARRRTSTTPELPL